MKAKLKEEAPPKGNVHPVQGSAVWGKFGLTHLVLSQPSGGEVRMKKEKDILF